MAKSDKREVEIKQKVLKRHFGYSEEEMKLFMENPRNQDVLSKAEELLNNTIVLEIIDSHGCNSKHRMGDKYYFDGAGNLLTDKCPKKICFLALNAATPMIYCVSELLYAGVDPNEMRFRRAGCPVVGLHCGGWEKW